MPLVSMAQLLANARRGRYAVCYCEAWNLGSLQAVVETAEELRSPVITGFNGGFLIHRKRRKRENLAYYASLGQALHQASVPLSFLLNETNDFAQIQEGMDMGFNSVMVENEHLGLEEYRQLVKRVVEIAHAKNLSVEAAVGRLPDGCGGGHSKTEITDPITARAFVEETGIDALAVSIGNVHVLTRGQASIDLEALERIRNEVKVPLVLHGGTGIPLELAKDLIVLGVAKINFGTGLKQAYLVALREKLAEYGEPLSPHPFLGMGGEQDIMVAGREAVKHKVRELLTLCGSAGKA